MTKPAVFLDLFVVLVFAAAGRASHDLSGDVLGVLATAWPFLVGMALGWAGAALLPAPVRRWWLDGFVVSLSALVVGMLLRWATGEGTALPFVIVATGILVGGLVGWRAVAAVVARRSPDRDRATA
ncbi:DUF3054 domain-containing protein [Ornithinimicrobium pekingense]|uniref:DUF3054 domain-containing protein n=1 Tax=Ornithinimicrobium pekingense TaxID=384677 RepID=A0ABQ2FBA2_9MICO|nr:DUF3054 domain-containing protein [Ornithinimicrobium pekingense]GGK75421.1 hypothetical protein GCM10011509_25150 [Ornithinimicrobium pekingense]